MQVVFDPDTPEAFKLAEEVRSEFVLKIEGLVRPRPAGTENPNMTTGMVELLTKRLEVLNPSLTPPFQIDDETINENIRLQYRYLDLRREPMQKNLKLRYRVSKIMRDYLDAHGFMEIETPMLTRSTPEGARDYLVPSRVHDGMFYALPQVAAVVQATADGLRRRSLLPDHQVLPRRGPARRPPARIHAGGFGDLIHGRGADHEPRRGHDPRHDEARAGHRPACRLPAHDLCRSDASLRFRQARHAGDAGNRRRRRRDAGRRVQGVLRPGQRSERPRRRAAHPRRRVAHPQRDRRLHRVRQDLRRQGPGLHQGQRRQPSSTKLACSRPSSRTSPKPPCAR